MYAFRAYAKSVLKSYAATPRGHDPEAGGGVDDKAPEILVRGTCKLCKQQVWSNQERWKSITDGVEDGYYIHKACHDRLNNDQVGGERPNTQM